jgi:carbamate kinase
LPAIRTFRVSTSVAAIDLLFRVQEEDHEREVIVEFKQVQIDVLDPGQANPDKLVGKIFDPFQTDNLPVKR